MHPIHVVLHPCDFSRDSEAALPLARALARDHGARLILLHVAPIEIVPDGAYIVPLDRSVFETALADLRARVDGPDLKLGVETLFREGDPASEIVRTAEELPADLIVMGTHGRTGLRRLVLGSVAEAVLRHATCPVLTLRHPSPEGSHPTEPRPIKEVTLY